MEQERLRQYKAIVWQQDPSVPGKRIELLALDLEHASAQIRAEYGEGAVVSLWTENDANASR